MGGAPSTLLQEPALMLGGADVLEDGGDGFFSTHGIGAVLSVCDKRPAEREGLQVLHINLPDHRDSQLAPLFAQAAEFIHTARAAGTPVYVHCTAGISRSTTMCTAYLMSALGLSRGEALGHIHRCREAACPNEGFLEQLDAFDDWESFPVDLLPGE